MAAQTRRQFLELLAAGAASGASLPLLASCTHSTWEGRLPFDGEIVGGAPGLCHAFRDGTLSAASPRAGGKLYDVIIVGGGVSGLTAAWKLARSGVKNLLLLERASEIGGTCIADEASGVVYSWGAHYAETPHPRARHAIEIYEALGVVDRYSDGHAEVKPQYVVREPEVRLLAGGKWSGSHFPLQVATSRDRVEYETFRRDMYRWCNWRDAEGRPAFCYPIEYAAQSDEVRGLDRISMLDYLDRRGLRSEQLRWYVNDRVADEYGCRIDEVSAYAGILFWAQSNSSFRDYEPPDAHIANLISWPEGLAFITRALASALTPPQVQCGTLVTRVENQSSEALVTTVRIADRAAETIRAKRVIYAAPKHAIYHIMPELAAAKRREFEKCQYTPWIVANVHLSKAPPGLAWENLSRDAWGLGYVNAQHMVPSNDSPNGPAVLTFYAALCGNRDIERQELLREGWEFWARLVLGQLEHMHPGIACRITRIDVRKWGHAMIAPTAGYVWGDARAAMRRPEGRVHFAHSDVAGIPVFEQTSYRGFEVAQEAMEALDIPYQSSI